MTIRQRKYRDNNESKRAPAPATIVDNPEMVRRELRTEDFFAELSIDKLANAQKVMPFKDISDLAGGIPADQDIDEFLGEIYAARR